MAKREAAVTFKGNPVTLDGPELKAGDAAPDFQCLDSGLAPVSLGGTGSKARLFSVVPSLDTPVCSTQTKRFAERLAAMGDKIAYYTVSLDLPFAQSRFCGSEGLKTVRTLSDCHDHSFGKAYGVLAEGLPLPLLARAVFVVDKSGTVTHAEYVPEMTSEPDYDKAVAALEAAA